MERRLIRTFLSKKPMNGALAMSVGMILLSTFLSLAYWNNDLLRPLLAANKQLIFEDFEIWRLFTTTLVHGDLRHLLSNSYMLGILSFFVYGYFRSVVYPLWALVFAALTNVLTMASMPSTTYLIGASGMVYWLAGFWLTIYIFIERQKSFTQRIVRSLGVALMTLFPSTLEPQVSYKAHGIGFLLGFVFAIVYFMTNKDFIRSYEKWKIIPDEDLELIQDPEPETL